MHERSSIIIRDPIKPAFKNPRVTIVIGFACKDAIVFASDSQGTYPNGNKVKLVKKLFRIDFINGSALAGFSGYIEPANRFVELFRKAASSVALAGPRTAAEVAGKAADQHRSELLLICRKGKKTKKERTKFLADNSYPSDGRPPSRRF
jgi:hypothetical protein